MRHPKTGLLFVCLLALISVAAIAANDSSEVKTAIATIDTTMKATDITLEISGPGAVNDSTIKAGEPVTFELHWVNEIDDLRGFATGFHITSDDITRIVHVADTVKGLTDGGDVRGYNGWENASKWNFNGVMVRLSNWDGTLPDSIGFAGLVASKDNYNSHEKMKVLTWKLVIPKEGTIRIDSTYYPPGGVWESVGPRAEVLTPNWGGPYTFKVVK